ncbi:MAG: hypothetical protein QOI74_3101 [Micromonosporaceae bacterium]|jgi:hypothetical protein|nr:hypothetical protein [Micromonosporaceae bacterium]
MGGKKDDPRAYSTQVGWDSQHGYHADGYNVVINPGQLADSVKQFRGGLEGQGPADLIKTVTDSLVAAEAFGQLPNAGAAYDEVRRFVHDHATAMSEMGVSVADFVARVQAAADLGYQADPATRNQAAMRSHGRMRAE